MNDEVAPLYWLEVAEAIPVRFGDLPGMLAMAQFPADTDQAALRRAVAAENIAKTLTAMVLRQELTVRSRHGMTPLELPVGRQLEDGFLIPTIDLAPLRTALGIGIRFTTYGKGPTFWTIEAAANAIADHEAWTDAARDTLRLQMLQAARSGALRVRHPHTDLPIEGEALDNVRDFYELVSREDVVAWLREEGVAYQMPSLAEASPAPPIDATVKPPKQWKMRVQAEAAAEWKKLRALGCNPTRASIRPHLVKWCRENDVKTDTGINPADGYLRSHVLSGKHWTPPD